MLDRYNRDINYLRISVTQDCNLRCVYCAPDEYRPLQDSVLSIDEILDVVQAGVRIGLKKIRLTGGEPLLRRDIVEMVAGIKGVDGIEQIGLTTNGIKLPLLATSLRRAGLDSVNISLDTLEPDRFRELTRVGSLSDTISGVEAATQCGLSVKINMVILSDTTNSEMAAIREFCDARELKLQLIRQYSLEETKLDDSDYDRPPPCEHCNRIRLLANGMLKPCLHSDTEIKLNRNNPGDSLVSAINSKPARGAICAGRKIIEIGG